MDEYDLATMLENMQEQTGGIPMLQNMQAQTGGIPMQALMQQQAQAMQGGANAAPSGAGAEPLLKLLGITQKRPISMLESDEMFRRVNSAGLASKKQQQEGLKKFEEQIAALNQGAPTGLQGADLTALLALADQWTGSNLAKSYKAPESASERKQRQIMLEQAAQKMRQGITDTDIDLAKLQWQNANNQDTLRYGLEKTLLGAALKGPKLPNKDQFDAAGYAKRMAQAEEVFSKLGDEGYDRTKRIESLKSLLPGEVQSESLREQDQAERNFVNAVLRRESGAAISDTEFDSAKRQYFPRPGDTEDVLAQKAANRRQVFESLKAGSGPAWDLVPNISAVAGQSGGGLDAAKKARLEELRAKKAAGTLGK